MALTRCGKAIFYGLCFIALSARNWVSIEEIKLGIEFAPARISVSISLLYARFKTLKQPISRGCKRCDQWAGIQSGMILFCSQIWSNLGVRWLPCPSRIKSRYAPCDRWFIAGIDRGWSHRSPISSVVQSFWLISMREPDGNWLLSQPSV